MPEGFAAFEGDFVEGRPIRGVIYSPVRGGVVAEVTFAADGTLPAENIVLV